MSNYTKTVDFAAKDSLPSGDSGKIIKGTEFETEFDNIATAIATKSDSAGPTFTGVLTFASLKGTGATTVTTILDEDDMSTDSATALATQQSIKAYVDAQQDTVDTLAEILALGNATGGTDIAFGDNDKAIFGASSDLQIYHDGADSYINEVGTGNLLINADNLRLRDTAGNPYLLGNTGAEVRLYYNGNTKVQTTATGIDVTGTVTADGLTVDTPIDTSTASFRATTNSTTIGQKIGSLDFFNGTTNAAGTLEVRRASGGNAYSDVALMASANGNRSNQLLLSTNGDISFYEDTGTTAKLFWDSSDEALRVGGSSPVSLGDTTGNGLQLYSTGINLKRTCTSSTQGLLHLNNIGTAGNVIELYLDGVQKGAIGVASDAALTFAAGAGSSERMRIDSSGNVGIGTSSPASLVTGGSSPVLSIGGTDSGLVTGEKAGSLSFITNDSSYTATYADGITGEMVSVAESAVGGAYGLAFYAGTTGSAGRAERLRITNSGNVGIGTTSPSSFQAGAENLVIGSGSGDEGMTIYSGTTNRGNIYFADGTTGSDLYKGQINYFHDSDYLRFVTDASEAMRIDSSGHLGINVTDPIYSLEVQGEAGIELFDTATSGKVLNFRPSLGDTNKYNLSISAYDHSGGGTSAADGLSINAYDGVSISTGSSTARQERMRIDQSGNLLVGTTDNSPVGNNVAGGIGLFPNGSGQFSRDGGTALLLNRKTDDGTILDFRKDGVTVGSISADAGYLAIGKGDTGLLFQDGGDAIQPRDITGLANRDAAIDLGVAGGRFKDLYLSGGAYLGGTAAANKLDDYEEGTWTPTIEGVTSGSASLTIQAATYTKIGNTVHAHCYLSAIDLSADDIVGDMAINGLPFNVATNNLQSVAVTYQTISSTYLNISGRITSGFVRLAQNSTNQSLARTDCSTGSGKAIMIGCIYPTSA